MTNDDSDTPRDDDFELIHAYSRQEALADGILIDVTDTARQLGYSWPVALTSAAFQDYVRIPPGVAGQDMAGRLWDVLYMGRLAIKAAPANASELLFHLYVRNNNRRAERVTLKLVVGPGDDAEPVITILLPTED